MNINDYIQKYKKIYKDTKRVSVSLQQARATGTVFYRGNCYRHGKTVLYTKDNTCPICQRVNREKRLLTNREFNRARGLRGEIARRAGGRNIPFDLTTPQIRSLIEKTQVCPILGIELDKQATGHSNDASPSVDRLYPDKGYVYSNVNIVSTRANRIKSDGTSLEHLLIAAWMFHQEGYEDIHDDIHKLIKRHKLNGRV